MKLIIALVLLATSLTANAELSKMRICRDMADNVATLVEYSEKFNPAEATPEAQSQYEGVMSTLNSGGVVGATVDGYKDHPLRKWSHAFEACMDYSE